MNSYNIGRQSIRLALRFFFSDTPSRTAWEDEDDDATPLKRSSWDLPTPLSRDPDDRSERSFTSSHRGSKDRRYNQS